VLSVIRKINYQKFFILCFCAGLIFLTQASSLDREVIDWDESTFAVISKSIINGKTLYVDSWDTKPPVLFYWMALFIKILGSNLFAIRFSGDVLIFLTSFFLYKIIDNKYKNHNLNILGCTFFILLFNFNFAQPTLTELPGLFFITLSIFIHKHNPKNTFTNGFIIGLAIMSRTNLGFLIFAFLIIYLKDEFKFKKIIYFLTGSSVPFLLFSAYFFYKNAFINFLSGVFIEITYSSSTNKIEDFYNDVLVHKFKNFEFREAMLILIILITFYVIYQKNILSNISDEIILLLLLLLSIALGRSIFYHYLIQTYTIITIFFIEVIYVINIKKITFVMTLFLSLLQVNLVFSGLQNIYNYQDISKNYPIKKIANELNSEEVLAITDHLIYFYNDNESPIVVHPGLYNNKIKFNNLFINLISIGVINRNERELALLNQPQFILCDKTCNDVLEDKFIDKYQIYDEYLSTIVYKLK
jgi:4-amino-4-deoxy-L-arabinose transferase-like glycosyltransferase